MNVSTRQGKARDYTFDAWSLSGSCDVGFIRFSSAAAIDRSVLVGSDGKRAASPMVDPLAGRDLST